MKKFLFALSFFCLLLLPTNAFALPPDPQVPIPGTAQYEIGIDDFLYWGAFACKLDVCPVGTPASWSNYSSTTVGVPGDAGLGQTLVMAPGDTLSFFTPTQLVTTQPMQYHVTFDLAITGSQYLESFSYYAGGNADLDGDEILYSYDSGTSKIMMNGDIDIFHPIQLGIITAKIKPGTPDGTIITARMSLDGSQFVADNNPFVTTAYAAEVGQSTIRLQVRNSQTGTTVLPKTGASSKESTTRAAEIAFLGILVLASGYFVAKRKIKAKK